jgi:PIN domain nuclease of toxin-antitoxin system
LLLDTHVLLWWLADDPSLGEQAARAVEREPEVSVSAASVWEIAIKQAHRPRPRRPRRLAAAPP